MRRGTTAIFVLSRIVAGLAMRGVILLGGTVLGYLSERILFRSQGVKIEGW